MKAKNKGNQKDFKQYIDLLYMTSSQVNARDIASLFEEEKEFTIQLWEDMNIVELELSNQNFVDFEPLAPDFKDPSDAAFIKNRNIKTIFAISLCDTDLPVVTPHFDKLVDRFSGFVCADSSDFTPVYSGSSKR